jgi:hypothetical protein
MSDISFFTVGELAARLNAPAWKIRRVVDSIGDTPRAGQYRLIPSNMLDEITKRLTANSAKVEATP